MLSSHCSTLLQTVLLVELFLRLHGTRFCHHSPNKHKISEHLRNTVGCDTSIQPNDYIYATCYKVHSSIIKALESKQQEPDCTLQSVMDIWIVKCNDENTNALTRAVLKVVLFVAEQLLQQKSVLLPKASQVFLQAYGVYHSGSISSLELHVEVDESNVNFCFRWLLNQLIIYLSPYMLYLYVHKKLVQYSTARGETL